MLSLKSKTPLFVALVFCLPTLSLLTFGWSAERSERADTVRIGLIDTVFHEVPESLMATMAQPFTTLMTAQTGMVGKMVKGGNAESLGRQLAEEKLHLGIFHGIEFAWARQKYPELRPLVIAVNQQTHLRAFLICPRKSDLAGFADLQGQSLALPRGSRDHCLLFLERQCQECGQTPPTSLCRITAPPTAEDALDDVVDGIVPAAIVDGVSLDCYKRRKAGRYACLKALIESEVFPAAVVAYRPGTLDNALLARFRESLLNVNKTMLGRQLLTLWKMTGFEPVPADYEQILAEIVKAYPAPISSSP